MPDQRRGPADIRGFAGPDRQLPSARRAGRARRLRRIPGLSHPALLRQPDRQADRPWPNAAGMHDAAPPGAGRIRCRRHPVDHSAFPRSCG